MHSKVLEILEGSKRRFSESSGGALSPAAIRSGALAPGQPPLGLKSAAGPPSPVPKGRKEASAPCRK